MGSIPGASLLTRFFGRTVSEGAAFALGTATGPALRPIAQEVINETWKLHPVRPPDAGTLAVGVAQGQVDPDRAREWASEQGLGGDQFDALVHIADTGPGVPAAFDLFRRGIIDEVGFRRAAKRQAIEPEWVDALVQTKDVLLSTAEVANAVQQGHLPNPGVLPDVSPEVPAIGGQVDPEAVDGQPPQTVPLTTVDLDPILEAAGHGVSLERLQVIANLAGLPPGPEALLTMWNRGLIDEAAVNAGIREGHMKTKWTGAYKRMKWAVLTAAEYAGLHLRGWIDADQMYQGGRLTGHTKEQMDLLYLNRGRPLSPTQAATAWARESPGPTGPGYDRGPHPFDHDDFIRAVQQSNVRTEYAETLWANRFAYPPLFQINRLVTGGQIDAETALDWAAKNRYAPEVIAALRKAWTTSATGAEGKHASKADTALFTATHRSYVSGLTDRADAEAALAPLNIEPAELDAVFVRWDHERELTRKQLSAAQVKRLVATGELSLDDAVDRLVKMGYSVADAAAYLRT